MQEIYTLLKRKNNPYILFFLLSILLYMPSSFFRFPFMPDEVRNLYIAKNISNFYEFFIPKYIDEYYFEKPPFYFWILKIFLKIKFNYLILPIFLNSISSFVIASLNYSFFKKYNEEEAFLSSIIILTTGLFYGLNLIVRMDILFITFIFLSFISFLKGNIILSSVFTFLATFTKGPLGLFILVVNIFFAIFLKDKKIFLKSLLVLFLSLFLVFLWLFIFSKIEPRYFTIMFFRQTVSRALNPFNHREPFYFYILWFFPAFFPWSFLLIRYFLNLKSNNLTILEKVYIFWFLGGFILLSFIKSKLFIYLLILIIPFSGLVSKFIISKKINIKNFLIIWIFILIFFGLTIVPFISYNQEEYKILKFIKSNKNLADIYTLEKKILLLNFFLDKKIKLDKKEEICNKKSILVITKEDIPCAKKLTKIRKFSIFHKDDS